MYGTIAKMKVKKGQVEDFRNAMEEIDEDDAKGYVATYLFQMDSNPDEIQMIAIFKDEESYRKNAEKEDTHQNYLTMMEYLEAEPEWQDGKVVYAENA